MIEPSLVKAVAIDIDGTLINSQEICTPYTKEVLKALLQTGRDFYIVTGRSVPTALPFVEETQVPNFFIAYNGAVLWGVEKNTYIEEIALSSEVSEYLFTMFRKENIGYIVYVDNIAYHESESSYMSDYLKRLNGQGIFSTKKDLADLPTDRFQKYIAFGDNEVIVKINEHLLDKFGNKLNSIVTRPYVHNKVVDIDFTFIEAMNFDADKGKTLARLAERQGFSIDNIMSFGDDINDIGMIKATGWGVAMGNAREAVKKVSDDITLCHDEDGVAHYIEKYLL